MILWLFFSKFKVVWKAHIHNAEFLCTVGLGFLIIEKKYAVLKCKNDYILTFR